VIYDAPPLLGVADTVALAGQVDGVVLVVDSTRTRRGPLAEAVERLERTNTALWGVVLNKLSPQLLRTYRRYGGVPRRPDAGAEAGVPVWGTVSGQPSAESRS
jgi:Mrp family chromosome partitioning ATPase